MAQTAAHLVDHVIPHVPVRQWVLSLPIPLRVLLAAQPKLVTPVLQVVHRVITRHLLGQAGLNKADEADNDGDSDEARTLRPLQAAACTYRIAFGPRAGQKVLKLKTAWSDGTTHLVMSPLEFMQRLAALVSRPRLHLIRLVSA